MFKLRYVDATTKDPIISELESDGIKFIQALEKIQNTNKIIYGGLHGANTLIGTLPNIDYGINNLKLLHATNFNIVKSIMRDYYILGVDLVDSLSEEIEAMSGCNRLKTSLEQSNGLSRENELLIQNSVYENPEYKESVRNLLDIQFKFKKISNDRLKIVNNLVSQLSNLLALQKMLLKLSNSSDNLSKYNMSYNNDYISKVMRNIKDFSVIIEGSLKDINNYHHEVDKYQKKIMNSERSYRKIHATDPNFYLNYTPITGYKDAYTTYSKLSRALDTEIKNLENEANMLGDKEKSLNRRRNESIQMQMYNPNVVGLASEVKSAKQLVNQQLHNTDKVVTEISDCIKGLDKNIDYCVRHLKSVKNRDLIKTKNYIDYVKFHQKNSKDKIKYSNLLLLLYKELNRITKENELKELDTQQNEHKKRILSAIEKQMQAKREINENTQAIGNLRKTFSKFLGENNNDNSKYLSENTEKLLELAQENEKIAYTEKGINDEFIKVARDVVQPIDSTTEREDLRKDINDRLMGKANIEYNEDGTIKNSEYNEGIFPTVFEKDDDYNLGNVTVQNGGLNDDMKKDLSVLLEDIQKTLHKTDLKNMKGGANDVLINDLMKDLSIKKRMDLINSEIERTREILYAKINPAEQELGKLRVDLSLHKLREELMSERMDIDGCDKLTKKIERAFIINGVTADINAYMKLKGVIRNSIMHYRTQTSLVRKLYTNILRKVPKDSSYATDLTSLNSELGTTVGALEKQLDKVNSFCNTQNTKIYNILKDPVNDGDRVEFNKMKSGVELCGNTINELMTNSQTLTNKTQKLLNKLDEAFEKIIAPMLVNEFNKYRFSGMNSMTSLYSKANQLTINIAEAIKKYIDDYIRIGNISRNYQSIGTSNYIYLNRINYLEEDIAVVYNRLQEQLIQLSEVCNKITEYTNNINNVINNAKSANQITKEDQSKHIIKINILLKERSYEVDYSSNILNEINILLNQQKQKLDIIKEIELKHSIAMFQTINDNVITLFNNGHSVKSMLVTLVIIRDSMVEHKQVNPQLTNQVSTATTNLLETWKNIKDNLKGPDNSFTLTGGNNKLQLGGQNDVIKSAQISILNSIAEKSNLIKGDFEKYIKPNIISAQNLEHLGNTPYRSIVRQIESTNTNEQTLINGIMDNAMRAVKADIRNGDLEKITRDIKNLITKFGDRGFVNNDFKKMRNLLLDRGLNIMILSIVSMILLQRYYLSLAEYYLRFLKIMLCVGFDDNKLKNNCNSTNQILNSSINELMRCQNTLSDYTIRNIIRKINMKVINSEKKLELITQIISDESQPLSMLKLLNDVQTKCSESYKKSYNSVKESFYDESSDYQTYYSYVLTAVSQDIEKIDLGNNNLTGLSTQLKELKDKPDHEIVDELDLLTANTREMIKSQKDDINKLGKRLLNIVENLEKATLGITKNINVENNTLAQRLKQKGEQASEDISQVINAIKSQIKNIDKYSKKMVGDNNNNTKITEESQQLAISLKDVIATIDKLTKSTLTTSSVIQFYSTLTQNSKIGEIMDPSELGDSLKDIQAPDDSVSGPTPVRQPAQPSTSAQGQPVKKIIINKDTTIDDIANTNNNLKEDLNEREIEQVNNIIKDNLKDKKSIEKFATKIKELADREDPDTDIINSNLHKFLKNVEDILDNETKELIKNNIDTLVKNIPNNKNDKESTKTILAVITDR